MGFFNFDGMTRFILAIFGVLVLFAAARGVLVLVTKMNLAKVVTLLMGVILCLMLVGIAGVATNPGLGRQIASIFFNLGG